MDELDLRMLELASSGFYCAQIMMLLDLERTGEENSDLVRSMGGLTGGMGFSGNNCGVLTGGACILGRHASKGDADELENSRLDDMIREYSDWFDSAAGGYGGIDCRRILDGDQNNRRERCPSLIRAGYEKIAEILDKYGCD